jgi:small-conductance mechanosensitive channel
VTPAVLIRLVFAALLAAALAVPAGRAGAQAPATGQVLQSAPVKIANRWIIDLRGPIAGYSAADRAKATTERIEKILASDPHHAVSQQDAEGGEGIQVLLAGKHAFFVAPIDVNPQAGETPQIVAREAARRLETAMREWEEQRTPQYLATACASAAGVTALFAALLWVTFRANRWLGVRLSAAAVSHAQKLHVGGASVLDSTYVLVSTRRIFTLASWLIILALASAWLTAVLELFPYTRPWGEDLNGSLLQLSKDVALAIVAALPGLLLVVVIYLLARGVARLAGVFFERVAAGRIEVGWLDADTALPTKRIFNFVVAVFAVAMAYPYLPGASTEAFKGVSVLVGVMISLGGASVIGQAFSGLVLMYAKAFRAGDYVRIGEAEGTVKEIRLFATRIRTGMGEEITLPNAGIMASTIRNFSRAVPGTGFVVHTAVTIGYSTPWRQVHAMLEEAARRTQDVVRDPAPIVRQTALSDFYVEYRLAGYTPLASPAQRIDVLSRLHANIQDVFNENGVQIMSPHYMADTAEPLVVPKHLWNAALAGKEEPGPAGR